MQRPQVHPALRRLWRDATTLQLGVSPHGTVLTGLQAGDDTVLASLDGRHDVRSLRAVADSGGLPSGRVDELIAVLRDAGALVDAAPPGRAASLRGDRVLPHELDDATRARLRPDAETWSLVHGDRGDTLLAARARRSVVVDGAGRLGAAVATTLAAAGVGRVRVVDPDRVGPDDVGPAGHTVDDVGLLRSASALRAVRRVSGAAAPRTVGSGPSAERDARAPQRPFGAAPAPDVVVLVRDDVVDVRQADELVQRDQVHLAVVVGADRVVVGPLVRPGRGPCLRCLDLHRRDKDPAWPHVAAQLLAQQVVAGPRGESASSVQAAALAALQVLGHLDGRRRPAALGATLEVELPDGLVSRRPWAPHPSCGCTSLVPLVEGAGHQGRPEEAEGTMEA